LTWQTNKVQWWDILRTQSRATSGQDRQLAEACVATPNGRDGLLVQYATWFVQLPGPMSRTVTIQLINFIVDHRSLLLFVIALRPKLSGQPQGRLIVWGCRSLSCYHSANSQCVTVILIFFIIFVIVTCHLLICEVTCVPLQGCDTSTYCLV
jgi:hypothetical protein